MGRHSLGEFEHLILLAALRLGDEAYGVTIVREVEAQTGRDVSQAAAYLTLRRLEEKGWLKSRKGPPSPRRGGRERRYFIVPAAGRARLKKAREGLLNMWDGVVEELG